LPLIDGAARFCRCLKAVDVSAPYSRFPIHGYARAGQIYNRIAAARLSFHPCLYSPAHMGCFASRPAIDERAEATVPGNDEEDLLRGIREARAVLAACPQGHPDRAMHAERLGQQLYPRHRQTGDISLIDECIEAEREALALRPPGHPDRALSCGNLAISLHTRSSQCGDPGLLDEAIELEREALALRPPGHPDRALSCAILGSSLHARYDRCSGLGLLDEAIELEREALDLHPPGHPDRAFSCANLGDSLCTRYEQCGDVGLLDEAIKLQREALALEPPGHPDRALSCENLGSSLQVRYEQCSDIGLLDEAIGLEREALALRPPGHPHRAVSCNNLGSSLRKRYEQCGDVGLLDEGIELRREALALRPPGHPSRADSCGNLGVSLHLRYDQCGDLGLLDEAIELEREALALQPPGHPSRADSCGNLGSSLGARYRQCGDAGLLDEAIELKREALALRPPGHPNQALECRHLSYFLIDCYEHTQNTAHLDEAIKLCNHSLRRGPSLEAWRSSLCLFELHMIPNTSHFSFASALGYLNLSFASEFDNVHYFILHTKIYLSWVWDASSVWASDTPLQLCNMYTRLIDHLPLAAGFVLNTSSRLQILKSTHHIGTDAFVAAILAKQPSQAIELLDRAHGMVWAQALHQRDPQTEGAPPELAAELADHLRAIAAPAPTPLGDSSHLTHHQDGRHKRNTRIQAILREIRATRGSERFMLGASYDKLRMAAREHPVIVLVAGRGHAFALIMSNAAEDQPHALRLDLTSDDLSALRVSAEQAGLRSRADMRHCEPEVRLGLASRRTKPGVNNKSHQVLADIWRKIIQPILRYLQLEVCTMTRCNFAQLTHTTQKATGRSRPLIHWCANGDFVFLPLHAAGIYSGPQASRECCSDYVVSSYTPTISALLRAQAQAPSVRSADVNMLLVGEDSAKNPGLSKLCNVRTELTHVESIATTKQFGHTVETIAREATVTRVTERIKTVHFVHLACHGLQHRTNALESGFYLNDDKLTISKLMELHLDHPWLAYLSACETAKGDAEQPDQVMHLAAAMLFAGFKHVVATMWYAELAVHLNDDKLTTNTG
jgi:tetratricopeptide (TPR) repeat protein